LLRGPLVELVIVWSKDDTCMMKVERNVLLNAPVEKVYDYTADPQSNVEIIPGMIEVRGVEYAPECGS